MTHKTPKLGLEAGLSGRHPGVFLCFSTVPCSQRFKENDNENRKQNKHRCFYFSGGCGRNLLRNKTITEGTVGNK